MRRPLTLKDHHHEQRIFSVRLVVGVFLVLLLTGVLIGRMIWLQVIEHNRYTTLSDNNRVQTQAVAPPRGLITDRHGEILADNRPDFSLEIIIEQAGDLDQLLLELGELIELDEGDRERFEKRRRTARRPWEPVPLRGRLTEEEIARLVVNQHRLAGIRISADPIRHYPHGILFSHVLGYVNRINVQDLDAMTLDQQRNYAGTHFYGRSGIERFYEDTLHGEVGYRQVETNARGRILRVLEEQAPVPGKPLRLHLSMRVQQAAYDALGERRGAVVAIDPRDGSVLAFVSRPGFLTRITPPTATTTIIRCSTGPCRGAIPPVPPSSPCTVSPGWMLESPTGSAPFSTPVTINWKTTRTATGTGNAGATAGWICAWRWCSPVIPTSTTWVSSWASSACTAT